MPILSLPEAKKILTLQDENTQRDALISDYCEAVDAVVEQYVNDWVVPRSITVDVPHGGVLPGRTVRSVVSAEYRDGTGSVPTGDLGVEAGVLSYRTLAALPARAWRVTLEVGYEEIPAAIKRGAGEILAQAWQTQRGGDAPPAFLVPYRAAAWLDPFALVGIA